VSGAGSGIERAVSGAAHPAQTGGLTHASATHSGACSNGDLENSNGVDPVNVNRLISYHLQFNHMAEENLEI
jgi:hypothetical protein